MDNDTAYVASWLQAKVANSVTKPQKQTPEQQYLAALYHCGESPL